MDIDDSIQASLPGGGTIPVRYNEGSSNVTNEDTVAVTWANIKALGGGTPDIVASMTNGETARLIGECPIDWRTT